MTGGLEADWLAGGDGNDVLVGLWGDDHLWGNAGDDQLLGGAGLDRAYFFGARSAYSIVTSRGTVRVVDNAPATDGSDGTDTISSIEQLVFKAGETVSVSSPIILDLDGNGVTTVAAEDSDALYDLDGDGLADDTSWIGNTEGFLFLDRDGNGTVTNAGEFSFIDDVAGATSDLAGLKAFDSNADNKLSSADARWADFKVWRDNDGDGAVDSGEILSLATVGLQSLNLVGTAVESTSRFGEVAILNRGSYTTTSGTTRQFVDAALTYFSAASNVPELLERDYVFGSKDSKFRINISGGKMAVASKKARGDVDPEAGLLGASATIRFSNKTIGMLSPVVLDLDGNGVDLVSIKKANARFDMNGDGAGDDTGWISKRDGFLVIDRDDDGRITTGAELSLAAEDEEALSGLEGLARLDSNRDGKVDASDARFAELKLWVDANGNGVSDAGELRTLAAAGIKSIRVTGTASRDRAINIGDGAVLATASFTRTNGTTGTVGDAALAYRPGSGSSTASLSSSSYSATIGNFRYEKRISDADALGSDLQAAIDTLSQSANVPNPLSYFNLPDDPAQFDAMVSADAPAAPATVSDAPRGLRQIYDEALTPVGAASAPASDTDSAQLLALMRQNMASFTGAAMAERLDWKRDDFGLWTL
ncbi:MAG: hypothetical protein J7500_00215 [Sphingomonas sp.]|nr:hypothetical protein [Sphingomonas sp.]